MGREELKSLHLLFFLYSAIIIVFKDDLEFHLRLDFYCLHFVYSIILPKEHSTLYFEHFIHEMY